MATLEQDRGSNKIYFSIVGGKIKRAVPEGTAGAVMREWEAGGKKGVKWELEYPAIFGYIKDVSFFDGEGDGKKFSMLQITFDGDENEGGKQPVLSVGVKTRYANDLMMKFPNVNFEEEVRVRPFSFTPENEEKVVSGVEITKRGYSGNFDLKVEKKWTKENPIIKPTDEELEDKDWESFFNRQNKALIKYTKENIIPKFLKEERGNDFKDFEDKNNVADAIPF